MSTTETREILIEAINLDSDNVRRNINDDTLKELAKSIKDLGVLQAIRVEQTSDGKFDLVYGQRRVLASKIAGMEKIPATVVPTGTHNGSNTIIGLVENIAREPKSAYDEAKAICLALGHWNKETNKKNTSTAQKAFAKANGKITAAKLSKKLGQSEGFVSQRKTAFMGVTDNFREAWKEDPQWTFAKVRDTVSKLSPALQDLVAADPKASEKVPGELSKYCKKLASSHGLEDDPKPPSAKPKQASLLPKGSVLQTYRETKAKFLKAEEAYNEDYTETFDPNDTQIPEAHKSYWMLQGVLRCLTEEPTES